MTEGLIYEQLNTQKGRQCQIDPLSRLENVVLGDAVRVANGVQLLNVAVGSRTKISRNVTFYSTDAGRPVRLGENCWISFGVFGEGTGGRIEIGDYSVVAHRTTLLTSSGPGKQSPILEKLYSAEYGSVLVGPHCWIGAHCVVLPGVTLPEGVVIATHSTVRKACYESWAVYGGSPARLIKRLDRCVIEEARAELAATVPLPA